MPYAVARLVLAVTATVLRASVPVFAAEPLVAVKAPIAVPQPIACPTGTQSSRDYAFNLMGNRAGYQTVCLQADGTRVVHFAFNDRGRGPALTSKIQLDAKGIPVAIATDGNDYLKSPVAERFTRAGGNVTWQNKVESGTQPVAGAAFYISQSGSFEEIGLLARALRDAPGRKLPLLPQGEADMQQLSQLKVGNGESTRQVSLYSIGGLGFQPTSVWLDEDGELFATFDSFSALVRAGWQDALAALRAEQDTQEARRRTEQARTLRRAPTGPVVIEHANLFDAEHMTMRPGTTVVIAQRRIVAVGPDGSLPVPAGAERIDAAGRALLPGLWDMHTHPDLDSGPLFLAAGVTSIRDMAAEPDKPALLRVFDTGEALGPRVAYAGIIDGRGPFQGPTKMLVSDEAEARTAVQAMSTAGFGLVKIYSSMDPKLVPAIADEARKAGMRVGGHVPAFMTAEQAVLAGYDEIQHMNMVLLNFLYEKVQDTRTPARFTAVAENAASVDPQSARVQAFLQLLKQHDVTLDPTLVTFADRPGVVGAGLAAVADRMPPLVRRGLLEGGLPVPEGEDARYRQALTQMQRMLMAVRSAGVPFVAGTDAMPGFMLPRELELYVEAGVPAPEVLRIATLDAARLVGRDGELGSIVPGKLADMILVDGDPSRNVGDVRQLRLVIKDGALFDPDALCRALGIQPMAAAGR
jgi:imidazolonepropionase-like amidohydrolase